MARGRQQKWVCKDCKKEFSVQGDAPKFCCSCGSVNLGRAPSFELAINFEEKEKELAEICAELNLAYKKYASLKKKYDSNIDYWKQQKKRGYISQEDYLKFAMMFEK